jgi:hypothetical protein
VGLGASPPFLHRVLRVLVSHTIDLTISVFHYCIIYTTNIINNET